MRICSACGKSIRDGASFCTSCGAPAPGDASENAANSAQSKPVEVPLITLAPQHNTFTKQRALKTGKMVVCVFVVIALALGVAVLAAWLNTDPMKESSFEEVENESYRQCLSLVNDVRNDNFDEIIDDLITMSGDMENYNFLVEYEKLFKQIIPDEGSDATAIKFRNCCFMVAFTEYTAKKYESYTDDFLGMFYVDDANDYRAHADKLWAELNEAQTDAELQAIIDYCRENNIIWLKDDGSASASA